MYRKIDDFKKDWQSEMDATLKIFGALTDETLDQKVYPEGRTLGRLAWHIVLSLGEMMKSAGIKYSTIDEGAPVPATAKAIVDTYKSEAEKLLERVPVVWRSDEAMTDEIEMYGEKWTKGQTLSVLVVHQIHHRAQMTVLMRQAGLKVPGIYGPAKEEWPAYGMPVQE